MTTDQLLKKYGIIRYRGELIYPEKNTYYYRGASYPSLLMVEQKIDSKIKFIDKLKDATIVDLRK